MPTIIRFRGSHDGCNTGLGEVTWDFMHEDHCADYLIELEQYKMFLEK